MSKKKLFDDDSDDNIDLHTENEYAKKYDSWREKEEIHKLEQKYGTTPSSDVSASSDSEDESDEPPEVSEEMETQFLKTLALLKTKDPRIYDPKFKFYDENKEKEPEKQITTKTLTFEDSDEDDEGGDIFKIEKKAEIDEDDTPNKRDVKSKTNDKGGKLKDYLTGKAENVGEEVEKDLAPLKALWSDPKLNDGEAFLRDYILKKRYLEPDEAAASDDGEVLAEDERAIEEQATFERAYNFRFEEPDQEYLKRFPRTMNSIRPKEDKRARKRAEVKSRKEEEKQRKMQDLARLKALKLREIQQKIAKIKEVTGNDELAFKEEDMEGDFDPEEHDRRMRAIFDEQFYGDQADEHKPRFPDLDEELEIENWDKYDVDHPERQQHEDGDGPHCEDADFNMDAEYEPRTARQNLLEEIQQTLGKKRRHRKKKSKLGQLLATQKPQFDPTSDSYSRYMDEYYAMDCEDIIGDLPTRFKYREVEPNNYGLTVEEILLADDKELTQWVPLKKLLKRQAAAAERARAADFERKAADPSLKKKLLPSLFKHLPDEPEVVAPVDESKKQKKKKKKKAEEATEEDQAVNETTDTGVSKVKKNNTDVNEDVQMEEVTLNGKDVSEDNTNKSKKRKKKKQKKISVENNAQVEDNIEKQTETNNENSDKPDSKKKRKRKSNGFLVTDVTNEGQIKEKVIDKNEDKKGLKRKNDSSINTNEVPMKKQKNDFAQNASMVKNKKKKKGSKKNLKHTGTKHHPADKSNENPLSKLSDGRLKAFGLNPKKYRSFLKFKKF